MSNLLIIGDSFCESRAPESWCYQLGEMTNSMVHGKGLPGQSWWQQYKWFNDHLTSFPDPSETTIIWCHTSAHRLPHSGNAHINPYVLLIDQTDPSNEIDAKTDPTGKLFQLAKEFYSSDLYVEEFYAWSMVAWWKELSKVLLPYKKVIHIFGFSDVGISDSDRLNLLSSNSVVVTSPSLSKLSFCENKSFIGGYDKGRHNHFNAHNNTQLAKFLMYAMQLPNRSVTTVNNINDWQLPDLHGSIFFKHLYGVKKLLKNITS